MAAGNSYSLGIKSNDFFLKDNKKAFILGLNVPKVTAYYYQKFDKNMSFVRLEFEGVLPIYVLEWKYLVAMLSCPVVKSIGPIELKCYEEAA